MNTDSRETLRTSLVAATALADEDIVQSPVRAMPAKLQHLDSNIVVADNGEMFDR